LATRLTSLVSTPASDGVERFYQDFLERSPEVAPLFAATDFSKQRKLLRASVYVLATRDVEEPQAREMLERIGESHGRARRNIRPELYEVWLDALCQTVRWLDPTWSDEVEQAWREKMRPGIDIITSMY